MEYDSTVSYDPGTVTSTEDLYSRVVNAIVNYSKSTDINSFGGRLKYSKLLRQIDNVDAGITSNITNLVMRRNLVPAYDQLANYELCYANKFHAEVEGFNIRSSGFKVSGIDGNLFLTDVPDTNITIPGRPVQVAPTTGSISIIKFNENNEIITVIADAGTVDYVKGEIILFPINISSTSLPNRIEIGVTPESNDIVAKENLYIVLDTTGKSVLTLKEDLVTSGSSRSGTNYIPPSSYTSSTKFTR